MERIISNFFGFWASLMSMSQVNIGTEVRKFQALKRHGTQISLDMTLEIKSQVKGHSRYGLDIFREGVKLFNG